MTTRKKIAICGASWFTSDLKFPRLSFGEKLAKKVGLELVSLARGGCSNFTIALQIDKAIELGVDYVVVGPDTWDRVEIPILNSVNEEQSAWYRKRFNWADWFKIQRRGYKLYRGLSNIQYRPHPDLSSKHEFLTDPTTISESLNNLAFPEAKVNDFYKLNDEQITALKLYMLNLYDSNVKQQQDCWIISDACRRLQQSGIPFIIFVHPLFAGACEKNINWLPSENTVYSTEFNYRLLTGKGNARFHYDPNNSDIFADFVIKKLNLTQDSKPQ